MTINKKYCNKCREYYSLSNFSRHLCIDNVIIINEIIELYDQGYSIRKIVNKGYSRRFVRKILSEKTRSLSETNKLARKLYPNKFLNCRRKTKCDDKIKHEIDDLYFNKDYLISEIVSAGYSKAMINSVLRGRRKNASEIMKLQHRKHPEKWKHSEKTKKLLRKIRLDYMKKHQGIPRWKEFRKDMSYPEKIFYDLIKQNNLSKTYDIVREYCIFPYYIDFAFLSIKLAVEIDGSQHWRSESRRLNDNKKEKLLTSKGWHIYRIPEFKLKKDFEKTKNEFLNYLKAIDMQPKIFKFTNEIIEYEKIIQIKKNAKKDNVHKKRQLIENRKNRLIECRKNQLLTIDKTQRGWISKIAKLWGVSYTQVKQYIRKNKIMQL